MIYLIGDRLYQWDTGRQVEINYPHESIDDVQFSSIDGTEALIVKPVESDGKIIANIPNILLQQYKPLRVYLTVSSANGEKTVYHKSFTIIPRERPSGYVYTETEVMSWSNLDKRITDLEENGIGGGDGKTVVVECTPTNDDTAYTPSHTSQEIYKLIRDGYQVTARIDIDAVGVTLIFVPAFVHADSVMFVSEIPGDKSDHDVGYFILGVTGNTAYMSDAVRIDEMTGATDQTDGVAGLVPAPSTGQQNHVLFGDATWKRTYTADQTDALLGKKADKVLVVTATENEDGSITTDINSKDIVAYVNGGGESVMRMEDVVLPLIMVDVDSNIATYGTTMLVMDGGATPMTALATVGGTQVTLETLFYDPAEHGFIKSGDLINATNTLDTVKADKTITLSAEPSDDGEIRLRASDSITPVTGRELYDLAVQGDVRVMVMTSTGGFGKLEAYAEMADDMTSCGLMGTITETDRVVTGMWLVPFDDSKLVELQVVQTNHYTKSEIDTMFGSYVNDIAELIGGEAIADS